MKRLAPLAPLVALTLAAPATMAETRPNIYGATCPAILTVQSADCTVSVIRQCPGDATGATTSVNFGPDGYLSAGAVDAQGAWTENHTSWDGAFERTLPNPADPISLDDLLRDGIDTYNFRLSHTEGGVTRELQVIGADILTGRQTTIDGLPLDIVSTDLRILETDGTTFYQTRGEQYVSPEMRLWFLGSDSVLGDDGSITNYDSRPVDFLFPGDPGFGVTTPLYGCGDSAPSLPAPASPGANTDK